MYFKKEEIEILITFFRRYIFDLIKARFPNSIITRSDIQTGSDELGNYAQITFKIYKPQVDDSLASKILKVIKEHNSTEIE